jgi:probable phosphoglycerate mutase
MKTLWIVRHAETVWNALGKISGWHDVELSELGRRQALALAPLLKDQSFTHVWSSDLQRARDTARLAYGEPTIDRRLRELDFGTLEGLIWGELPQAQQDSVHLFEDDCAPGGETIRALEERVFGFIDDLSPGDHLIFAHGGVIRAILRQVQADQFVSSTSLGVIDWTDRKLLSLQLGPHFQPSIDD